MIQLLNISCDVPNCVNLRNFCHCRYYCIFNKLCVHCAFFVLYHVVAQCEKLQ